MTLLFENPFVTVRRVEMALEITNQGARKIIQDAESRGLVSRVAFRGRGGRQYWVVQDIFDDIEEPPIYSRRQSDADYS